MKKFLRKRSTYAVLLIILISVVLTVRAKNKDPEWTTATVETGTVRNVVSVSGVVDAIDSADLAFPSGGTLASISVKEGDSVTKGQVLATLSHDSLSADYQDASANLRIAEANRDELTNGIRPEEKAVSKTNTEIAKENLARITTEQNDRVNNAYKTLLSSNLAATPNDNDTGATPPTVSGTYTCGEGVYTLTMYNSSARSGYSYRLSGLERGTYTAYTESPAPMGSCGLNLIFTEGQGYGNTEWTIEIPNKKSAVYLTNKNAYDLALTERTNAINEAKQKLVLAEQNNTLTTATPRTEAVEREEAKVLQAQARINAISAQIKDRVLVAPFTGTVTNIDPVVGETVTTAPIITMVSDKTFALTTLIPEIDITKIAIGQKADVVFDARPHDTLSASVIFISPLAKKIDGVSYFEAKLILDNDIDWLRSGLNADVDIILEKHENVTRIPKRYMQGTDGAYTILVPNGKETQSKPVEVLFTGNDGFVEVKGVTAGDTIIAP